VTKTTICFNIKAWLIIHSQDKCIANFLNKQIFRANFLKMRERILQVIDYYGLNIKFTFIKTGLSNGFLDKAGSVGTDKLEKVMIAFPDVDPIWLLTGKGEMFLPNSETRIREYLKDVGAKMNVNEPVVEIKTKNRSLEDDLLIKLLMKSNSDQEAEILELKRRIKELEQRG